MLRTILLDCNFINLFGSSVKDNKTIIMFLLFLLKKRVDDKYKRGMPCFKIIGVWCNYRTLLNCRKRYQVKWREAIQLSSIEFLLAMCWRHWWQMSVLLVSLQVKGQAHSHFLSLESFLLSKNTLGESRLSSRGRSNLFFFLRTDCILSIKCLTVEY